MDCCAGLLKTGPSDPMSEGMGAIAMTVTQASLTLVGAMVVLVVVTASLEAHTPARRVRPTRLTLPRRIDGRLEDLPELDLAELRTAMATKLATMPVASSAEVVEDGDGPVTELVPVVVMDTWASGPDLDGDPEHGPPTLPVELVLGAGESVHGSRASTVFVAAVDEPGGAWIELGEPGADRRLAGVLFAGYVAGGFPERSRVTGWVTPIAAPPGRPALYRGADLRGRSTRVSELLACGDLGRNWVDLQPAVDIGRGIRSRPPADEVLRGILWWWGAATLEHAAVAPDDVAELRAALEAVVGHLAPNVMESTARELLAVCEIAVRTGSGIRVRSVSAETIRAGVGRSGREAVPEPVAS